MAEIPITYGLNRNAITAKWIAGSPYTAGYPGQPARFTLDRVIEWRRERLLSEHVDSDVVTHEAWQARRRALSLVRPRKKKWEVLENGPSGADFYRSTSCEAPLDVGRTLPSTEPIEPPATIPAAIGIPADEALQHILDAVSPGSMDVPDAAALRVLERDGQLNLWHDAIVATETHGGV